MLVIRNTFCNINNFSIILQGRTVMFYRSAFNEIYDMAAEKQIEKKIFILLSSKIPVPGVLRSCACIRLK